MKRLLSMLLVMAMCFSLVCTAGIVNAAEEAPAFTDVTSHWAKDDIIKMAGKGIIKGISETEFAPDMDITRAQFLTLIVRVLDPEMSAYGSAYTDVTAADWYASAVQTAKYINLIDPAMTPGNEFKPNQPITREEMTSLIVRAYEYKSREAAPKAELKSFTDKDDISQWATAYVSGALGLKIVSGMTATTFAPANHATRAQAATMISRLLANNKVGKSISILSIGNSLTGDSMKYFGEIAKSMGYDNVTLGRLHINGEYLKGHYENLNKDSAEYSGYTYMKQTNGTWDQSVGYTITDGIKDEAWDYIIVQGASEDGGNQMYDIHIDALIKHIRENATNTKFKLGWMQSWGLPQYTDHYTFEKFYNSDQMTMYNSLTGLAKKIAAKKEMQFLIPAGTAIQNARGSFMGDTMNRDGHHLDEHIGCYISGLTWYCAITGTNPADITYNPNSALITPEKYNVAIEAVTNALAKPYGVTESQYK